MKQKNKNIFEAGGVVSLLIVGFICALFTLTSVTENVSVNTIKTATDGKSWHMVVLGDIAPGAGQSGIVNISIVKHGLFTYSANVTRNASMFAYCETNNTEMTSTTAGVSNVKYGVRLDVLVKVRWNRTHMFNTTSHVWNSNWVRGNISMTVFGLENQSMIEWNITGQTMSATLSYLDVYYVFNSSGSGFWINKSQRVKSCYFRGWAYY